MSNKWNHKYTAHCPIKSCKYTSRIPNSSFHLNNKNSCHSKLCPKHRMELITRYKKENPDAKPSIHRSPQQLAFLKKIMPEKF